MSERVDAQRRLLDELRRAGAEGRYRDAFHAYHRAIADRHLEFPIRTNLDLEIRMHLAIAYQHAGDYHHSLALYREVEDRVESEAIVHEAGSATSGDILAQSILQQAVLRGRLRDHESAQRDLQRLGEFREVTDLRLGNWGYEDWYLSTVWLNAWNRGDVDEMKWALARARESQSSGLEDWIPAFELGALGPEGIGSAAVESLRRATEHLVSMDRPGAPWLQILAGDVIQKVVPSDRAELYLDFYKRASRGAAERGKLFLTGEASCRLHQFGEEEQAGEDAHLVRALRAFGAANMLYSNNPLYFELVSLVRARHDRDTTARLVAQAAGIHPLDKDSFKIGPMCTARAQQEGRSGWDVLEDFVADWALARYGARYVPMPKNYPVVDGVLLLGDDRSSQGRSPARAVQVKLAQDRRAEVRKMLYKERLPPWGDIKNKHACSLEGFWFVLVQPETPDGVVDELQHDFQREIEEHLSLPAKFITENHLRTDVLIFRELQKKYFPDHPHPGLAP